MFRTEYSLLPPVPQVGVKVRRVVVAGCPTHSRFLRMSAAEGRLRSGCNWRTTGETDSKAPKCHSRPSSTPCQAPFLAPKNRLSPVVSCAYTDCTCIFHLQKIFCSPIIRLFAAAKRWYFVPFLFAHLQPLGWRKKDEHELARRWRNLRLAERSHPTIKDHRSECELCYRRSLR